MESASGVSAVVVGSILFRYLYFCNFCNSNYSAAIFKKSENKKNCILHFRRFSITDNPDNPVVLFY